MATVSTDAAVRGAALPITVYVAGVDLTSATEIIMTFARSFNSTPTVIKKKTLSEITVTYDSGNSRSVLTLTLSDSQTASWTGDVHFSVWIDDSTTGGYWTDKASGIGTIQFANAVQRS